MWKVGFFAGGKNRYHALSSNGIAIRMVEQKKEVFLYLAWIRIKTTGTFGLYAPRCLLFDAVKILR
jgi:hypothetical protein